jgi:hypothetical protein
LKHKTESIGYWYKESNRIRGESATKTTELKGARRKLQDSGSSQAKTSRQLEEAKEWRPKCKATETKLENRFTMWATDVKWRNDISRQLDQAKQKFKTVEA